MVFELRLNAAMKRSYQLKGGWEPGSRMDEKSQRTGDRWLRVVHSFMYRASKFDGNSLENSRQRYRWYRYIGRPNICASLQPRYPLVSHRFQYSIVIGLMFRKLWKFYYSNDCGRFSLICDWYFENYKNFKYKNSIVDDSTLIDLRLTILLLLIYNKIMKILWYLENYKNSISQMIVDDSILIDLR